MVVGKDDLGLSLSLPCTTTTTTTTTTHVNKNITSHNHKTHHHRLHFETMMMMMKNSNDSNTRRMTRFIDDAIPPLQLNLMITPSDRKADRCRSIPMSSAGDEDDAGLSSANSAVSTVSGKRSSGDALASDDADVDRSSSRGNISDDEDGGENSRKKLRLSKDQSAILEESFKEHNTLNPKQKLGLAKRLGLRPRQVEVWFQNHRARTKLKQTEVDCEFLKGYCEKLTEEKRRLQKEVEELRTLKLSPHFYMHMTPPTTLTMCPSCERVSDLCRVQPPADAHQSTSGLPCPAISSSLALIGRDHGGLVRPFWSFNKFCG